MAFSQTILMVTLKIWDEYSVWHTEVMQNLDSASD